MYIQQFYIMAIRAYGLDKVFIRWAINLIDIVSERLADDL